MSDYVESPAGQRKVEQMARASWDAEHPDGLPTSALGGALWKSYLADSEVQLRAALTDEKCGTCEGTGKGRWEPKGGDGYRYVGGEDCSACGGSGSGERLVPESALEQVTSARVRTPAGWQLRELLDPLVRLPSSPGGPK